MDLMMPDLHEQAAPAPWLRYRPARSAMSMIDELLAKNGAMQVDDIAAELRRHNYDLPGSIIAGYVLKRRG
jgi:hypothetical protein